MNWNSREEWQRHIKVTIGIIIFATLLFFTAINVYQLPEQDNGEPFESTDQRAYINQRIKYHGLNGVVVLYKAHDGQYRFERDGQWCKL
jgi:hypothetical protein